MLSSDVKQNSLKKHHFNIKPRYIVFILLFVFSWILFGLNYSNADYENYEAAYNDIKYGRENDYFEIGFFALIKLSAALGLSYQVFLVIISAVCLFIFTKALSYLTNNLALSFACYLIYPFVFDVVQYRNFLAFAFVLFGLHYLLDNNSKTVKNVLKYFLFVVLGSLFHLSVIIYSLFFLVIIKRTRILAVVTAVLFAIIVFLIINQEILVNLLLLLHLDRFARYTFDYVYSTFFQYCAVYLFFLFLAVLKFKNNMQSAKFKFLIISSLFLPFIIMNGTSARFIRNVFIIFYAFLLDYKCKKLSEISMQQIFVAVALIASITFVFYNQLCSGLYYDIVLKPVLQCNWLFRKYF